MGVSVPAGQKPANGSRRSGASRRPCVAASAFAKNGFTSANSFCACSHFLETPPFEKFNEFGFVLPKRLIIHSLVVFTIFSIVFGLVEGANGKFAPRQRPAFIPVHGQ